LLMMVVALAVVAYAAAAPGSLLQPGLFRAEGEGRWAPSPTCQAQANAFCASSCYAKIKGRPCDGPQLARRGLRDQAHISWACYSPEELTPSHQNYSHHGSKEPCFCSRDTQIRAVLAKCGDPDPSEPARPVPPPPAPPSPPLPPSSNLSTTVVFVPGEKGYVGMRIPAILMIPQGPHKGRLLAFCECGQPHTLGRGVDGFPNSGCDICTKVSSDSGKSWGPLVTVIKNASQPSPVYDTARSTVVMNFNGAPHCTVEELRSGSRGCGFNQAMISTTDGDSWGEPRGIDSMLGKAGHAAAGPGRGLQLTHGPHKGRLLFIGHQGACEWPCLAACCRLKLVRRKF
jgi:hypothetical protein